MNSSVTSSTYAANIELAAQQAANLLDAAFSNPITININVGYGEENGNAITKPNVVAQSQSNGNNFDYSTVKNALDSSAGTCDRSGCGLDLAAVGPNRLKIHL